MKKGFIIYKSLYEPIKALDRQQKGELLESIFEYQTNGVIMENMSPIVNMAFMFFKNQFDIDQQKYEEKCIKARESVNKRWERTNTNEYERIPSNTNDTDKSKKTKVKRKKKEEDKEKEQYVKKFSAFISEFNKVMLHVKGKKGTYRETEKVKKQFIARLKNKYTWEDWKRAIANMQNDDFHKENNYKYITPEFLTREDKLENWANTTGKKIVVREQDKGKGTGGKGLYEE